MSCARHSESYESDRGLIAKDARGRREAVVIDHVAEDDAYCNRHTPAMYGFQSYISMPIVLADGTFFGTLCAIDPKPTRLNTPEIVGMFKLFAELIAFHIDAHERLATSAAKLTEEQKTSELREQFIAVLGHDLRSPLQAVSMGAALLQRLQLGEPASRTAAMIQASVSGMSGLIDDVLDFARGRLGGGLRADRDSIEPLDHVFNQVVTESRAAWPHRAIEVKLDMVRGASGQWGDGLIPTFSPALAWICPIESRASR